LKYIQIFIIVLYYAYKKFHIQKKSGQAVDAPVEKCVLTKIKEENVYE